MVSDHDALDLPASILHETAKSFTSRLEQSELLRVITERIVELWQPRCFAVMLYRKPLEDLRFELAFGPRGTDIAGLRASPKTGALARALACHEIVVDAQPHAASELLRHARMAEASAKSCVVAVPLKTLEGTIGAIELVDPKTVPSSRSLSLLEAVSDYAAIALDNARNYARIRELTIRDDLTTLYNARHLRETLSAELTRAARFQRPVSIIFLDLDFFKVINDTNGHLVGSALLAEFGQFVARHIRKIDMGFRYGGDEFAVVLVETPHEGALVMASRFRELLRQQRFLTRQGLSLQLTASIGVATYPDDGSSTTDILSAADRAMYRAKEGGRDDVVSTRDLTTV
ncbi:MAG: sensor domain-containing diguanylate cyclase [Deltaproteobacteria bacterium]|nr:sensor domain-containing diguanylate cyclase [Deltaproteobacteria bacterium]